MNIQQQQQQQEIISTTEIEKGLDFIINHFDPTVLYFPRTIMTKKLGYQKEVFSREESLQYFRQSKYLDCRINAYRYSAFNEEKSSRQWTVDFIFMDLDRDNNFKSDRSFELALSKTLRNIDEKLGNGYPTILFTGGGCHIYQPIEGIVFENYEMFNDFNNLNLSNEFLRFSKSFLSNNKADKNNNPCLKSCLLRIPRSINSKYNREVTIVQKWNGYRPTVTDEFLEDFRGYLIQKKIEARRKNNNFGNNNNYSHYYYDWIENKILQKAFSDYRKLIVGIILAPYFIVIKKLSYEESYRIIYEWLQKCDSVRRLDFDPKYLINNNIKTSMKKLIPPISINKLETNYKSLYLLLLQDHNNNNNNNNNTMIN